MPVITVNGIDLSYSVHGRGEPLLLLMGLGAPGALWAEHLQAYASAFRCIVLDNRGAGGSAGPPGPYTTAGMADDAAGLLTALGVESAAVAGISMGSAIAQELALRHPAKVRRLVLVSSWARCDPFLRELFACFVRARDSLAEPDFVRLLQLWIWSPEYVNANLGRLQDARVPSGERMPDTAFAAQCAACITHDALDRLARIHQPCLLTVGDADIFTPLRLSAAMRERLPDARLEVFAGMGHCHHWEDPARFNRTTLAFLSQAWRGHRP